MLITDPCLLQNAGNRRVFWTTQQEACGNYTMCGDACVIPGLEYVEQPDDGRTIRNDNWILSLILNILNTRARSDTGCPSPASTYGHWSESYRDDNLWIGSRLWNAAEKSYIRIADSVKAIQAAIQADMGKLLVLGVVNTVKVEAVYRGRNSVEVTISTSKAGEFHVLNLSGTFVSDTWVWS